MTRLLEPWKSSGLVLVRRGHELLYVPEELLERYFHGHAPQLIPWEALPLAARAVVAFAVRAGHGAYYRTPVELDKA